MTTDSPSSRRIGGWLWFWAIGLPISQLHLLAMAIKPWNDYHKNPNPQSSSARHDLLFLLAIGVVGVINLWLLWLFFTKSKRFPSVMILWLALKGVSTMVDDFVLRTTSPLPSFEELRASTLSWTISCTSFVIWGTYFHRSLRVKETFTQPDTSWAWMKEKCLLITCFLWDRTT